MAPESWELVPSFLALAEQLHYGRAAARLGISAQALSKRIARLESQLGVTVVVRSTRRVELTAAGVTLRDHAAVAVDAMGHAIELTRRHAAAKRLSVGISTDLTDAWDTRVEAWVRARGAPAVLERRPPDDALDLVRADALDLVLFAGEYETPPCAVVGHEPTVVLFPADHPAADRTAIRLGDLRDLVVAVSDAGLPAHHRATVERLHGDPDLRYVVAPRVGTIVQGLVHAAQTRGAAAIALARGAERTDTSGLAALPLDPPYLIPVTLVGRPGLAEEPFRSLADHLLSGSAQGVGSRL